jgi:signal transduction histidine kinase
LKRLLPKSLIGQIALVMALALLAAQAINFGLILNERQRATRAQHEAPAILRFTGFAQRVVNTPAEPRAELLRGISRRGRFSVDAQSIVPAERNDERIADRLRETADANGLAIRAARGMSSDEVAAPRRAQPDDRRGPPRDRFRTLLLSIQLADGSWFNGRLVVQRPDPWLAARLAGSTLLIYLLILAAMVWIAMRLGRPLKDLAAAADRFQGRGEAPQVDPRGPGDVRNAIRAFNAMSARVAAMLDEKDRMLGAIGHDMRTPLASLRIRAESMEPAAERQKVIATIEEMTALLDDTLTLARSGRAREAARAMDLAALADTVVEEFRALGHDVSLSDDAERLHAQVQPNLLRRAVRNLVENGVKYGEAVRVGVRAHGEQAAIEVTDQGPGIAPADLELVQEPFVRLEASRSRETGGSGLGLTLARAAAQAHGGSLVLENRPEGGLLARILLPRG